MTQIADHVRELLAQEIKQEANVAWKRSRMVSLRELIAHYESTSRDAVRRCKWSANG